MRHRLTEFESLILTGAAADLAAVQARVGEPRSYEDSCARKMAAEACVKTSPGRWLGELTVDNSALRVRISRAYDGLEKKGLVSRVSVTGVGLTHLEILPTGIALAKQLAEVSDA
jgi:hypothetical protein